MERQDLDGLLSEEQQLVAQTVVEFARDRVIPQHEALDHAGVHPEELWGELAELGLFSTFVPEDQGGAGAGFLAHAVTIEELARGGGIAGILPAAQGVAIDALLHASNQDPAAARLEGLMTGETLGAPALMEEDAGFVTTVAEGDGSQVRLEGRKSLVPWPGRADLYVVRARRADGTILALVESGAEGLTHERGGPDLGLLGYETGDLVFAGTPGVVLGDATLLETVWSGARIAVSALLCGLARGALDHALRYSGERKQFGKELRQFTAMQERLCRIDTLSASLRGLVHGAARLRDAGQPHAHAARRARLFATEVAMQSAHDAIQVYGGAGYSREYPIERFFRDAGFPGFGEHVPHTELAASTEALAT